jgi:hypothetical protein
MDRIYIENFVRKQTIFLEEKFGILFCQFGRKFTWVEEPSVSNVVDDNCWEEMWSVGFPVFVLFAQNIIICLCMIAAFEGPVHTILDLSIVLPNLFHVSLRAVF